MEFNLKRKEEEKMDMEVINNELLETEEVGNDFICFATCCLVCGLTGMGLAAYGVAAMG